MATRTNDLTEFAKPVADQLAERCGSLKRVLSAGILALDSLSAEEREQFMAKATSADLKKAPEKHKKPDLTESIENVKYFVKFKLMSKEEQALLRELKSMLVAEEKQKKSSKKA